jgi:hypothetical protein
MCGAIGQPRSFRSSPRRVRHQTFHWSKLSWMRLEDPRAVMSGRLATRAEKDLRVHLVGYGPSASTIGANRAGRAAAGELIEALGLT